MNIKTYRKPNGDLNIDIDSVVETYPEIAGAKGDDREQKTISVALVPYMVRYIEYLETEVNNLQRLKYTKADKNVYKYITQLTAAILILYALTIINMMFP